MVVIVVRRRVRSFFTGNCFRRRYHPPGLADFGTAAVHSPGRRKSCLCLAALARRFVIIAYKAATFAHISLYCPTSAAESKYLPRRQ
jgi:hypothetical protein